MTVKQRIVSVDIFRGLTIALMILVNTPGTWEAVYAPLRHADWHGTSGGGRYRVGRSLARAR